MALLPFSKCAVPDPPDTGCEWLADTGREILDTALTGLLPFIPPETGPCADTFEAYLTMGPPVGRHYDALAVNLMRYGSTARAIRQEAQGGPCTGIYPQQQATWRVTLFENCWPVPRKTDEGNRIVVPSPEKLDAVAEHAYAHGIAMYVATVQARAQGSWTLPTQITDTSIGDLIPIAPSGGTVGWTFDVITTVGS